MAQRFAARVGDRLDARALGQSLLAGSLSAPTAGAVSRARKRIDGDRAAAGLARFSAEMNAMLSRRQFLSVAARRCGRAARVAAHRVRERRHRAPFRVRHPARRRRRSEHRRAVRRSRLRDTARRARDRPVERAEARRHLRAASGARADRRDVRGPSGAVRARGGVAVSRPLALRRAERAGDRRRVAVSDQGRLAQPARRAVARARGKTRSRSRRPCRWRCAARRR